MLCSKGFMPVPSWPGIFTHTRLRVLLTVYVDDFKLAGITQDVKEAWKLIGSVISIEAPTPLGRYLGCMHAEIKHQLRIPEEVIGLGLPGIVNGNRPSLPKTVRAIKYDMSNFLDQCVDLYLKVTGSQRSSLSAAPTPFLDEDTAWNPPDGPPTGKLKGHRLKGTHEGSLRREIGPLRHPTSNLHAGS